LIELLKREKKTGKIGRLELDATLSYTPKMNNDVTSFPIEDGSDISDHIRNKPREISLTGFITDTPVRVDTTVSDLLVSGARGSRVSASYIELKKIWTDRDVVDVITGLEVFTSMALLSLSVPRTPRDGHSIRFSASFREIQKVTTETVSLPNASEDIEDLATAQTNVGSQATTETGDKASEKVDEVKSSVLAGLFGG